MKQCEFKVLDTISGKTRKAELQKVVKGYAYHGQSGKDINDHIFVRGDIKVIINITGNDITFIRLVKNELTEFDYPYINKFFNLIPVKSI
jgi:hypothetical protein